MQTSLFIPARPSLEDWTEQARRYLRVRAGMNGEVTTDDIWEGIETGQLPPLPEEYNREPKHLSQVWDRSVFVSAGAKRTNRDRRHHGLVTVWRLKQ